MDLPGLGSSKPKPIEIDETEPRTEILEKVHKQVGEASWRKKEASLRLADPFGFVLGFQLIRVDIFANWTDATAQTTFAQMQMNEYLEIYLKEKGNTRKFVCCLLRS